MSGSLFLRHSVGEMLDADGGCDSTVMQGLDVHEKVFLRTYLHYLGKVFNKNET